VAAIQPNRRNRFDESGNYFYQGNDNFKPKQWTSVQLSWENPFISKIADLCKTSGTQLIVYQAPIYNTQIINNNKVYNFINNSTSITDQSFFYDGIHLNQKGREKASRLFADEFLTFTINK
jgi:hypothetical protein